MKAKELIWLYELGERNFSGQDLKGKSFRGAVLSDADFSRADLRGTDFTQATLRNVNFANARFGLERHYAIVMGVSLVLMALVLGSVAGLVDTVAELEFHSTQWVDLIPKWLTVVMLLSFSIVAVNRGIAASFLVFLLTFILSGMIAFASSAAVITAGAIAIAITLAAFVAVMTLALVIIVTAALLSVGPLLAGATLLAFGVPFLLIAVPSAEGSAVGLVVTVIGLSVLISWRGLRGQRQHAQIVRLAAFLSNRWSTCFQDADLTYANLTQTRMDSANFNGAILTSVAWDDQGRPMLKLAKLGSSSR